VTQPSGVLDERPLSLYRVPRSEGRNSRGEVQVQSPLLSRRTEGNPGRRVRQARGIHQEACEQYGRTLEASYSALGDDDAYLILDGPNANVIAGSLAATVGGVGKSVDRYATDSR
jgi:hypothetical protein